VKPLIGILINPRNFDIIKEHPLDVQTLAVQARFVQAVFKGM